MKSLVAEVIRKSSGSYIILGEYGDMSQDGNDGIMYVMTSYPQAHQLLFITGEEFQLDNDTNDDIEDNCITEENLNNENLEDYDINYGLNDYELKKMRAKLVFVNEVNDITNNIFELIEKQEICVMIEDSEGYDELENEIYMNNQQAKRFCELIAGF